MNAPGPPEVDAGLWRRLEGEARSHARANEPAHDFSHVERVVINALAIARAERCESHVVSATVIAALLHELFTLPKNHPESSRAGDECARRARPMLEAEGASPWLVDAVTSAIRDHSFSKGIVPTDPVTCILQDADRLDALGAIGLARMWATCADMKRPFYEPTDPFCEAREPNDKAWGLDHVFKKLLVVPERLHTEAARTIAASRVKFMTAYLEQLRSEVNRPLL